MQPCTRFCLLSASRLMHDTSFSITARSVALWTSQPTSVSDIAVCTTCLLPLTFLPRSPGNMSGKPPERSKEIFSIGDMQPARVVAKHPGHICSTSTSIYEADGGNFIRQSDAALIPTAFFPQLLPTSTTENLPLPTPSSSRLVSLPPPVVVMLVLWTPVPMNRNVALPSSLLPSPCTSRCQRRTSSPLLKRPQVRCEL